MASSGDEIASASSVVAASAVKASSEVIRRRLNEKVMPKAAPVSLVQRQPDGEEAQRDGEGAPRDDGEVAQRGRKSRPT